MRLRLPIAMLAVLTLWAHADSPASPWRVTGEVAYTARDAIATWRGVAPIESVVVAFDPSDVSKLTLEAVVLPERFNSSNALRDNRARATVFETDTFREARLTAAAAPTARGALAVGQTMVVPVVANLSLHGVTLPYTVEVSLTRVATQVVEASLAFDVSLEAHGMRRPRLLGLVTDDVVGVSVRASASVTPQAP